jgi:phosphomannomutase
MAPTYNGALFALPLGLYFMQVTASIFKAYDIRGTYPRTLHEELAEGLGRAFGTLALREGRNTVAVGRDGRLSGPALASALTRGLVSAGIQVIDVGLTTTPQLYFAAHTVCDSGIQVTGSHNPKDDNGFKMVLGGRAIYGDEIQTLRQMIEDDAWVLADQGGVRAIDILPAYIQRIVGGIQLSRPLKIVVDSGNGIAGASAPGIFRALGCEVIELFSDVDGNFPNHHPDPSKPENLKDLIAALQSTGAELGLAFDGDGDRLGIVTQDGETIYPDRQMQLFAKDVLSRVPQGTILFDVKCSQRLAPAIRAAGGTPLMYKTGHSLIKAKMKQIEAAGGQAPLGGEMSGHIFFKERWYGFDDGTYAGCRLLEIVSRSPDANAVLKALPTSFSTPELNVACQEGEAHLLTDQLLAVAPAYFSAPAEISAMDGLRVDWPDGFGLIRASNTTPVLVLRFEGHTQAAMDRIEQAMLALLRTVKPDARLQSAAH